MAGVKKDILVLALVLALTIPTVGCVDIHWAKDNYFRKPPGPLQFDNQSVELIQYTFQSGLLASNDFYRPWQFHCKPEARTLWVEARVALTSTEDDAFVKLSVTRPDGTIWWEHTYTSTSTDVHAPEENPSHGIWKIDVWARGYNNGQGFEDSFEFEFFLDQPVN